MGDLGGLHLAVGGLQEEPQRGPGKGGGAECLVFDVDQQPLRPGLLPLVHLVEGAHLAGRDAGVGELAQQGLGVGVGERLLHQLDDLVAVGDPIRVRGQTCCVGVDVERRTELLPQTLAAHRDLHRAVGAAEQSVRRDGRVVVALGLADLAGDRPPGALEGVHPDDAAQQ